MTNEKLTIEHALLFERNILKLICDSKPEIKGFAPMIINFSYRQLDPREAGEPLNMVYAMHKRINFEFINQ